MIKRTWIKLGLMGSAEAHYLSCDKCHKRSDTHVGKKVAREEAILKGWFIGGQQHLCPGCCEKLDIARQGWLWRA